MHQTTQFIDPVQLARIADLQLLARSVVAGLSTGMHRSAHSGASIEFAQYRPYAQGDDPRSVDWHVYARTDRLYIKQHLRETNMRCTILLDCSASMDYSSGTVTKFQYARMLAACLALILTRQKDAVGFIGYHHDLCVYVPPRSSPQHMRRVLVELDNLRPAGATDTARALHYVGDVIHPRGMVVLISDLLHPVDETIDHMRSLRARRHELIVLQMSDPAEQTCPFDRAATFLDAEGADERFAIPQLVREEYLENRRRHFDFIRRECLAAEIDLAEFTTTEPLDRALHYFIHRRSHALVRSSQRRGRPGGGTQ